MKKVASSKAVQAVKRGRASHALKAMLKVLTVAGATSAAKGLPRGDLISETNRRTKGRYKGSLNWCLFHLFNEREILSKQNKHGGGYYLNKKGLAEAKAYNAA